MVRADETPGHIHEHETDSAQETEMNMGGMAHEHSMMDHAMATEPLDGTPFSQETDGLPEAVNPELVTLKDGDSYDITASYVQKYIGNHNLRMLAYNRSVPGPFIRVRQDSEVSINFINNTDVEQTIHSHGVRVNNLSDGVPGITQDPVAPGETFTYTLKFRDAGAFWYHPHTREDYGQEMGLYGNYLIDPADDEYWNPVSREVPLVIDDVLLEDGKIAHFYKEFTNFALLGRFGNEYLVNGQNDFMLHVNKGEVIRFYLTNVSNVRSYNLSIPNIQTKVVGADLGKFEHEMFSDQYLISPAERLVIEAYFKKPGTYNLTHTEPDGQTVLARIMVMEKAPEGPDHSKSFFVLRHNDDVENEFRGFREYLDKDPDKRLLLSIDLTGQDIDHSQHTHMHTEEELHDHREHVTGSMEDRSRYQPMTPTEGALNTLQWSDPQQSDRTHITPEITWKLVDQDTGKVNSEINNWTFTQGDLVKIRITNDPDADHIMQHPIHLHGQQFVVLSVGGLPNNNLAWKDTTLVFPGQSIDILARMSNPGEWMAHCHISEHLHAGMAMTFRVEDKNGHAAGDAYRSQNNGNGSHNHSH